MRKSKASAKVVWLTQVKVKMKITTELTSWALSVSPQRDFNKRPKGSMCACAEVLFCQR